jgi:hypothetical protein
MTIKPVEVNMFTENWMSTIMNSINGIGNNLNYIGHMTYLHFELEKNKMLGELQKSPRYQDPRRLIPHGYKVYSQNEEDGIIREIFNRIDTTNKVFVELGVGNGLENNTLALLFENWKGLWIEGSHQNIDSITNNFVNTISKGQLTVIFSYITRNNINDLISPYVEQGTDKEIDLLSLDLDGNDYHIFDCISVIRPRVIVMEYNAKFHPPMVFCMGYNEKHVWDSTDNFGTSLKFLETKLKEKGYALVGCNLTGSNAFFVRQDLTKDRFLSPFTAENHFEPARYWLGMMTSGHPASYSTLENRQL